MTEAKPSQMRMTPGRNLTERLFNFVGREIVTGRYDGKRFPTEAILASEHHVSRPVTREAIKMLTAKGLLYARPKQGTFIQPISAWNLFDADVLNWLLERRFTLPLLRSFIEFRLAVEPMAAQLAARSATPKNIAVIAAGYAQMESSQQGDDDALEATIVFHIAILQACNNPFFSQFESFVSTALRTSISFTNRFNDRNAGLAAHRAVLDAIAAHDPISASIASRSIIEDLMILIRKVENEGR